jgi:hypothetical protein
MSDNGEYSEFGAVDPSISDADESDSLASPFLEKIPQADREIVGRYIKDWDAGVTRKFQSIRDEYRPYKDLGAGPDELAQAYALMQMVNDDPQRVYDLLGQAIQPQGQPGQQQMPQNPLADAYGDSDLPPQFIDKFTRMEQTLEALAGRFLQDAEQRQAEQEDQQLEQYMGALQNKYGEFDEDWVLSKMLSGMDGEEAVKQYSQWLQGQINSRMSQKRPVPVLGGGGSVPPNGVDPTKMSGGEVRKLVADMLAQSAGNQ